MEENDLAEKYLKEDFHIQIKDQVLIDLNNSIIDNLINKDKKEKAINLFEWVRDNINYEIVEIIGSVGTVKRGSGACVDKSSLLIALLRINKIPARYITLRAWLISKFPISEKFVIHCAVEAFINEEWIVLDPTFDPRFFKVFPKATYNSPGWWSKDESSLIETRDKFSKLEMKITSKSYKNPSSWKNLIFEILKKYVQ